MLITSQCASTTGRLAIRCLRPDLVANDDRARVEREMTDLGIRLQLAVDDTVVVLDPLKQGIYTTIRLALRRTGATAVIVPDLECLNGTERSIREWAQLITVEGEAVLERATSSAARTASA